jgi:hypothetical protein
VVANLRTPAKVEQAVTPQSTIHYNGSYVVPASVDIDGLSLTPSKIGLVGKDQRNVSMNCYILATWLSGSLFEELLFLDIVSFMKARRYQCSSPSSLVLHLVT